MARPTRRATGGKVLLAAEGAATARGVQATLLLLLLLLVV